MKPGLLSARQHRIKEMLFKQGRQAAARGMQPFLLCLFFLLFLSTGCTTENKEEKQIQNSDNCTKTLFSMDTYMTFTAYGDSCEEAVDTAIEEVKRLDDMLSTEHPKGDVFHINQTGSGMVSKEIGELLEAGMSAYQSTGGLFDFTIYPLVRLWGFTTGEYQVPEKEELNKTLQVVGAEKISYEDGILSLQPGQMIDFGGIAKGYAAVRVMDIFREYGISSAMVSLGGNIQVLGRKTDNTLWRIGIQNPEAEQGSIIAVLSIENMAVVTSGGYERYFEENGEKYIHILDPRTGYPARSGLLCATAVSADGTMADALSTSLYIMGLKDAIDYWREAEDSFEMLLYTDDKELYVTEGLTIETSAELHIITRED